ncbi:MAG: recombinase family protein [Dialister pneumosintes]
MGKEVIKLEPKFPQLIKVEKLKVAAYARVSTEKDEQHNSLEAQKDYFLKYIENEPEWEYVGLYYDDGISGLSKKNRDGFNSLVKDALDGNIDLIVTKSISRFARNTVDTISTIRKLKREGIGVFFQKENIHTLDSKSEFVLTLMSSFAQEESRSISENCTWGQRKRFADGKVTIPFARFLGYDRGENGELVVNEKEARIVEYIYSLFILGFTFNEIKNALEFYNIKSPGGTDGWNHNSIKSILTNEKYKGDALLQKSFTVDFMTKKKKKNEGELPMYYVENDHQAIIPKRIHDYVQRKMNNDVTIRISHLGDKIICAKCGEYFGRFKIHPDWYGGRWAWRCRNKYSKSNKCVMRHLYDDNAHQAINVVAFEVLSARKDLIAYVSKITGITSRKINKIIKEIDLDFAGNYQILETIIDSIKVKESHDATFLFIDGSKAKGHIFGTGKTRVKGVRQDNSHNYGNKSIRPEPGHFDEFIKWLKEKSGLSQSTQKSIRKRTRLAHSICKISDCEGYIEKLETRAKYKKLDDGVKSNVKYAVRVYFRFLDTCHK